jgi:hypothetical protein
MIKTAAAMRAALRKGTWCGIILYEGPSALDGAPVVVIVNRITTASDNAKTGAMTQSFVIRSDVDPITALNTGQDVSICGDCQHRPRIVKGKRKRTCYVNVGRSVMAVWGAFLNGRYARPGIDYDPAILPDLFEGLAFRAGTYGDPVAAPYPLWRRATVKAAAINGYTHQWRDPRFAAFRFLCMASADSVLELEAAHAAGWRTFRVRHASEPVLAKREAICPASAEAGKRTDCATCRACGGLSAKAKVSMVIIAHGATAGHFQPQELAA